MSEGQTGEILKNQVKYINYYSKIKENSQINKL